MMKDTREKYQKLEVAEKLKREFDWMKVIYVLHLVVLSIITLVLIPQSYITTILFALLLTQFGILGVTAGAHRLWAHRSYTASKELRFFLMLCQTIAGIGSIHNWVLNHRIHHKYYGTNYDPYNHKKGFLYSFMWSFFEKPHADVEKVEASIDMTDIENDKIVMFQHKFYWIMFGILHVLLPINAPAEYWGENLLNSSMIMAIFRTFIVLIVSLLVHSGNELWGLKPGERYPCETNAVFFITKTYWIEYHYLAPWDYLTSEFGKYSTDCTSKFIRACAAIGYATDLKTTDTDSIREAAYKCATTKQPIEECVAEIESEAIEKEYYLKPVKLVL